MLICAINSLNEKKYRINSLNNNPVKFETIKNSEVQFYSPQVFLGSGKNSIKQLQELKSDADIYPQDVLYRKQLMLNAGKNPEEYYKLRAIIGGDEIKSIMSEFNDNENVYSTGVNDQNIKNKTIRANLHIHTTASDGHMSTKELLGKAVNYADKVAKNPNFKQTPFVIAITDHDTTESAKEAIDIISQNSLKYKNLRVILGMEATTYNNIALDITKNPTNIHVLVYGIDPNEKTFNHFIESIKQKKINIASLMINQVNEVYKKIFDSSDNLFSLDEAQDFFNPLKKKILGIYNYVQDYIKTKIVVNEIILKSPKLKEAIKENNLPLNAKDLMKEIKQFYFSIDRNNQHRNPLESIPTYLNAKTNLSAFEIQDIIKKGLDTEKIIQFNQETENHLSQYKIALSRRYDYMPDFKDLYTALESQKGALLGLAHPLEQTQTIKDNEHKYIFLNDLYKQFKAICKEKAGFSEVYYQSYNEELNFLKNNLKTKTLLNNLSKILNLFKTGSADTHGLNIFKRYI